MAGTLPPPALPLCRSRDGVGVPSEEANRDRCGGGVPNADGVEDRRRRLRPGEEKVLAIGLETESSGEEGPEKILKWGFQKTILKKLKIRNRDKEFWGRGVECVTNRC